MEREAARNVECMWLTGKLTPTSRPSQTSAVTMEAIQAACRQFVVLCRRMGLIAGGTVAMDGSRFRAVNTRDKNFTPAAIRRRIEQVEASIARDLSMLDTADRDEQDMATSGKGTVLADRGYLSGVEILACAQAGISALCPKPRTSGAKAEGRFSEQDFVYQPQNDTYRCPAGEELTRRRRNIENGLTVDRHWTSECGMCPLKADCTPGSERRVTRWEHEHVIEAMLSKLDRRSDAMRVRRQTVEHVFGTVKDGMGRRPFKTRTRSKLATEMSLHVLAYDLKRAIAPLGSAQLTTEIGG